MGLRLVQYATGHVYSFIFYISLILASDIAVPSPDAMNHFLNNLFLFIDKWHTTDIRMISIMARFLAHRLGLMYIISIQVNYGLGYGLGHGPGQSC